MEVVDPESQAQVQGNNNQVQLLVKDIGSSRPKVPGKKQPNPTNPTNPTTTKINQNKTTIALLA